jgi:hypothetical protein
MIREYVILYESSDQHKGSIPGTLRALEQKVAAAIADGWQPFGSMSVDANHRHLEFWVYQPIVR